LLRYDAKHPEEMTRAIGLPIAPKAPGAVRAGADEMGLKKPAETLVSPLAN